MLASLQGKYDTDIAQKQKLIDDLKAQLQASTSKIEELSRMLAAKQKQNESWQGGQHARSVEQPKLYSVESFYNNEE